jgi:hypothetical protein
VTGFFVAVCENSAGTQMKTAKEQRTAGVRTFDSLRNSCRLH